MDKSSAFFSKGCPNATHEQVKSLLDVRNETLSERYLDAI
jgi:hypothetical protein